MAGYPALVSARWTQARSGFNRGDHNVDVMRVGGAFMSGPIQAEPDHREYNGGRVCPNKAQNNCHRGPWTTPGRKQKCFRGRIDLPIDVHIAVGPSQFLAIFRSRPSGRRCATAAPGQCQGAVGIHHIGSAVALWGACWWDPGISQATIF